MISRDLFVSVATSFLATALINGRDIVCSRDLFAQCFSSVDVATLVSCRDIVVFLFFQLLSCDSSFRLRPPFCFYDDFML